MNSAPHLLTEDRPEFERVLDEALRTAADAPGASRSILTSRQLRTMALSAAATIAACAAAEYEHYLTVRRSQRAARNSTMYATAGGGAGDTASGAGLFAIIAVLTPILAGAAALIFLLLGYLLGAMHPEPAIAPPLRTAGWLFAAIAASGILLGMAGLVVTALRDGTSAIRPSNAAPDDDVTVAREAWLAALRDRGVLPFIAEAQASSATHAAAPAPIRMGNSDAPRPERLGYSRPGFSSPGGKEPYDREADDAERRPLFGNPDFSSPHYSSPDFGAPEFNGPDTESY